MSLVRPPSSFLDDPTKDDYPWPEVREARLDLEDVERLLLDVVELTDIVGAKTRARGTIRLQREEVGGVVEALAESGPRGGLQLRYRYAGYEWWDTLMVDDAGVRLVRVRHEFPD